jgi:hypothetical protein
VSERFLAELDTLLAGEQRFLAIAPRDGDHHVIEQAARTLDEVDVTVGDRIEGARVNDASHGHVAPLPGGAAW